MVVGDGRGGRQEGGGWGGGGVRQEWTGYEGVGEKKAHLGPPGLLKTNPSRFHPDKLMAGELGL